MSLHSANINGLPVLCAADAAFARVLEMPCSVNSEVPWCSASRSTMISWALSLSPEIESVPYVDSQARKVGMEGQKIRLMARLAAIRRSEGVIKECACDL